MVEYQISNLSVVGSSPASLAKGCLPGDQTAQPPRSRRYQNLNWGLCPRSPAGELLVIMIAAYYILPSKFKLGAVPPLQQAAILIRYLRLNTGRGCLIRSNIIIGCCTSTLLRGYWSRQNLRFERYASEGGAFEVDWGLLLKYGGCSSVVERYIVIVDAESSILSNRPWSFGYLLSETHDSELTPQLKFLIWPTISRRKPC